jgi:RNA polymerase sigma-70 factor (ECF subfamily)
MFSGGGVDTPQTPRQERAVRPRLELVQDGSGAWLQRDHGAALRGFALKLCKSASDADDLVQDTLARALPALPSLQPGTNARAWLLSILHNLFIDRCRRGVREADRVSAQSVEHLLPAPEPSPEPAWARLGTADVDRALDQLDTGFRDVYRLHARGQSYDQIASALSIPRATVGTRLLRARKKLKALLFGGPEEEP